MELYSHLFGNYDLAGSYVLKVEYQRVLCLEDLTFLFIKFGILPQCSATEKSCMPLGVRTPGITELRLP